MTNFKQPVVPSLYDLLTTHKNEVLKSLRVCLPVTIASVNPARNTANVSVDMMQRTAQGASIPYPELKDLPIFTLSGGGMGVRFPVAAGDRCLAIFCDRPLDRWVDQGAFDDPQPLPNLRMHDLADGFVLVGMYPPADLLELALAVNEGGIADATAKVAIKGGKVAVASAVTDLLTELTTLITTLTALNTAIAAESGVIPTAAAAATAANASLVLLQAKLNTLLYTPTP